MFANDGKGANYQEKGYSPNGKGNYTHKVETF
jgi:hypothetical protein